MSTTILQPGVYVANLTPMDASLQPDVPLLINHLEALLAQGAQGIALLGTTGEANSFSLQERKDLITAVTSAGIPGHRLMVGTGCCAYTDTISLTRHAVEHGINSILMLPPFYYKQINDQGLFRYFQTVIEGVGTTDMEIYLYHFPKMTGVNFSIPLLEMLIEHYPNQVVGMKDSSGDLEHSKSICKHFPGFRLFAGTEKYLLDILHAGGSGCISATANVTVGQCTRVFQNWQNSQAEALQSAATAQRQVFEGLPFVSILKQYLAETTGNSQWLHVRPPNALVEDEKVHEIVSQMKDLVTT
ncbi:MAG: dihydrodipicolinate synthase family protein [Saprospiraceae bacterium]|nr:dihydrodipicolinate synthase family protein [Saprospiraceae bacterium]